jgi:hypothetical protein
MGTLIKQLVLMVLLIAGIQSSVLGASIENPFLLLDVDTAGIMKVTDKRTGRVWKSDSCPARDISVISRNHSVVMTANENFEYQVTLTLETDEPALLLEIQALDPGRVVESTEIQSTRDIQRASNARRNTWRSQLYIPEPVLHFPPPFYPEDNHAIASTELLLNIHEGMRIPMNDNILNHLSRTLSNWFQPDSACKQMRWTGMISDEGGYFLEVTTPCNGGFCLKPVAGGGAYAAGVKWYAEKLKFSSVRKVRYSFVATGNLMDYVRNYTGFDNRQLPGLEKLRGAADIWLWDECRKPDFIHELHDAGIDKAILSVDLHSPPLVDEEWIRTAQEMGYIPGRYNNTSIVYRKLGENADSAIVLKNNEISRAPGGIMLSCYATRLNRDLTTWEDWDQAFGAQFFDTLAGGPLRECYSNVHPATRGEDMRNKQQFLDALAAKGLILGSENVASWAVGHAHYFEGIMSMELFKDPSMRARRKVTRAESDQSQAIFLTTREAPGSGYLSYGLNEQRLVPLFELVAHSHAVSTWHWRDDNRKISGMWWKKNLLNILYGTMPLFNITSATWEEDKDRYVHTFCTVCKWHAMVATEPMTGFEYRTDDRKVQQTRFGEKAVAVVNFSDTSYTDNRSGVVVPPTGYYVTDGKQWSETGNMKSLLSQ